MIILNIREKEIEQIVREIMSEKSGKRDHLERDNETKTMRKASRERKREFISLRENNCVKINKNILTVIETITS